MVLRSRDRGRVGRRRHLRRTTRRWCTIPPKRRTSGRPDVRRFAFPPSRRATYITLPHFLRFVPRMNHITSGLPLLVGALGGIAPTRERTSRRTMERFAAATLETLLNAIDANDADTGAHVRRVAAFSLVLAEEAGLDVHARRSIERVALFHDIGKIHAALFDIIHDDTSLTPAERRAIATHPARGAAVLAPVARFYPDLAAGV